MSWSDHALELLSTNQIVTSIILGKDEGAIYSQSGKSEISEAEAETFAKYMNDGCKGPSLLVDGKKYMKVRYREDEEVTYFVCPNGGICAGLSNTLLVIGIWDSNVEKTQNAGSCNGVIEKKIASFRESNF